MKKYFLVALSAVLLFGVTGCGKKPSQVTCSKTEEEDGQKVTVSVTADLDKDDKITDASITYDFGDKEAASTYCSLFKMGEEEGEESKISCDGSKITIKGLDSFEDEEAEDSEKMAGKTKDAFIKEAQEEGYTCK